MVKRVTHQNHFPAFLSAPPGRRACRRTTRSLRAGENHSDVHGSFDRSADPAPNLRLPVQDRSGIPRRDAGPGDLCVSFLDEGPDADPAPGGKAIPAKKTEGYRKAVRGKVEAFHRFVQLGYIAQGLLQYLPLGHGEEVWRHFRSWMRTRQTENPPSERVVASALRSSLGEFLANAPENHKLKSNRSPI